MWHVQGKKPQEFPHFFTQNARTPKARWEAENNEHLSHLYFHYLSPDKASREIWSFFIKIHCHKWRELLVVD